MNEEKEETILTGSEIPVKSCWICYDNSANLACRDDWIEPCRCIGSTRWVHHHCLSQWIDRAESAGITITNGANNVGFFSLSPSSLRRAPVCPQCRMQYMIETRQNRFLFSLDYAKFIYNRMLVVASAVGAASGVYLITFSYGYAVCLAVYGADEFSNLVSFYLSSDSPLANQTAGQLSGSWSRSAEFARGAFLARCLVGIPLIPAAILSASFRLMHWLYPTIPALMLFGDRQIHLEWPIPERLLVSLLPFFLKGYRWARRQLEYFIIKQILKNIVASEFEQIERNLGINAENLEAFIRETADSFSPSPLHNNDNELTPTSFDELHPEEAPHNDGDNSTGQNTQNTDPDTDDEVRIILHIRRIADTLFVPFIGSTLGRLFFRQSTVFKSKFYRSIVGIGIFILVTDAGYMLSRYWKYKARLSRRILNFPKLTIQ